MMQALAAWGRAASRPPPPRIPPLSGAQAQRAASRESCRHWRRRRRRGKGWRGGDVWFLVHISRIGGGGMSDGDGGSGVHLAGPHPPVSETRTPRVEATPSAGLDRRRAWPMVETAASPSADCREGGECGRVIRGLCRSLFGRSAEEWGAPTVGACRLRDTERGRVVAYATGAGAAALTALRSLSQLRRR